MIARAAAAALALTSAVALWAGSAEASDPPREVCVEQKGAYVARVTWSSIMGPDLINDLLPMGETDCRPFDRSQGLINVRVHAWLGKDMTCEVDVGNRTGRLTMVTGGTSREPTVTCP